MALPSHLGLSRFLTGKGVVDVHPPPLASAFFPEWGHGKLRAAFLSLGPPGSATGTEGQGPVGSSEGDIQSSLQHHVCCPCPPQGVDGAEHSRGGGRGSWKGSSGSSSGAGAALTAVSPGSTAWRSVPQALPRACEFSSAAAPSAPNELFPA